MSEVERIYKPGDKAMILFPDGVRRAAEMSPGFMWVTADGAHVIFAEGGFDAQPLLTLPTAAPPEPDPLLPEVRDPAAVAAREHVSTSEEIEHG